MNIYELNKKNQVVTLDGISVFGKDISKYGLENGYMDYKCLSNIVGNTILNNNIINYEVDNWELINGVDYNEEKEEYIDIFEYYIIDNWGVEFLVKYTDEIVYYNEILDIYLWGITHWGTSWDYVLTNIEIVNENGEPI